MEPVLKVENVWKSFRIPHERKVTVFDHLGSALSILEGRRFSYEELWALKEVTFDVHPGESIGIVGLNGSGKSTLLKLIAGIMKPDKGRIFRKGSMATILELGLGFHGDLSVKENATIYGAIMGIPRHLLKRRINSILEFAGLTKFQDSRLKHLSSGMQVRLAFSIVIQSAADMFLVDEALAVGDIEFQERCLVKFREFQRDNKSIILVSHNIELINNFCQKAIYLQNGEIRAFGPAKAVTDSYAAAINK